MSPTEILGSCPDEHAQAKTSTIHCAEVENDLLDLWKELLHQDRFGVDDDFFDLGGNSLVGIQLFRAIKKKYGVEFGLSLLFEARSIRQLAKRIQHATQTSELAAAQSSILVPLHSPGSRPPLFWIPGGLGSSVLEFKEISLLLGEDQPVYGFEVEAPEQDEELEQIQERAERLIKAMRSLQPQGPYRLIGFCGGGIVAYEMAQQLSKDGQEIQFLGIVDCVDPHHPHNWKERLRFNSERAVWRTRQFLGRGPVGCARQLVYRSQQLGKNLQSSVLRFRSRLAGRPYPASPEDLANLMDRKVLQSVKRYCPTTYSGNCVVFIGTDTYYYAGLSASSDPRLIWCKLSKGKSEVIKISGDHLTMLNAPNVFGFAEQLRLFLH